MYKISREDKNFIEKKWKPGEWSWLQEEGASLKQRPKELFSKEKHYHPNYS